MAEQTCPCCGANLRISCNTAHPEHDCYHPDGHERPQPDWADLREMARNAGWSGRGGARWVMWGVWSGEDVADEHGWVIYHRFMESTQVTIVGPGSGHMGSRSHAELKDPTPAQVLTVVRQLGIGAS